MKNKFEKAGMKLEGFIIGQSLKGGMKKYVIDKYVDDDGELRELKEAPEYCREPGIFKNFAINVSLKAGRKEIDSMEWVGDVDSCLADELINML